MIKIEKYGTLEEANLKMQGGISTGVPTSSLFPDLVGNTITFSSPAGSCTFTQPAGQLPGLMSFADVKTQLETAIANLKVLTVSNKLCFRHATAGQVVSLAALDEPARLALGLVNLEAITGSCLNGPGGATPKFLEFVTENLFVYVAVEV